MSFDQPFDIEAAASTLRALANPTRLAVALRLLVGPCSVGQLETELGLRQPNLSQHLAELRDAGIVRADRQSRHMVYDIADDAQRGVIEALRAGFGGEAVAAADLPRRSAQPPLQAAVFACIGAR